MCRGFATAPGRSRSGQGCAQCPARLLREQRACGQAKPGLPPLQSLPRRSLRGKSLFFAGGRMERISLVRSCCLRGSGGRKTPRVFYGVAFETGFRLEVVWPLSFFHPWLCFFPRYVSESSVCSAGPEVGHGPGPAARGVSPPEQSRHQVVPTAGPGCSPVPISDGS